MSAAPDEPGTRVVDGWVLEHLSGASQQLHALDVPAGSSARVVRVNEVLDRSIVLGSTQRAESIDAQAAAQLGFAVARRRSGGGAVLLQPGAQVWLDVVVPVGDPLWSDDVERASWWLGEVWAEALADLRPELAGRLEVHRGSSTERELGRLACFASIGPGEVSLDGRKLVGISQRRTREMARLQCVVPLTWDPEPLTGSLRGEPDQLAAVAVVLRERVADLATPAAQGWSVVEAVLDRLP